MAAAKKAEEAAEGAAEKGGGRKLVLILAAVLVLAGGGGAAAWFLGLFGGGKSEAAAPAQGGAHPEGQGGQPAEPVGPPVVFVDLPDILVNLKSTNKRPRFLKLKVALEVKDARTAEQVKLRADRIGVSGHGLFILPETSLDAALEAAEELRRLVLTDEILRLPKLVRELAEAQRRAEERLERLEATVAALAKAQRRAEERLERLEATVAALAEAQRRTEAEIRALVERMERFEASLERFQQTQDRFAQIIGPAVEARMVEGIRRWLAEHGYRLSGPIASVPLDGIGELDGVAKAASPDGSEIWLVVSVKAKVWPRAVSEFVSLLSEPPGRLALQRYGVRGKVLPVVFGMVMDYRAPAAAAEARVGLILEAQGEIVPPEPWLWPEE